MIFQDPYSSLNPRMTVGEIIGEGLRLQHGAWRRRDPRGSGRLARTGRPRARPCVPLPARVLRRPTAARRHRASADHAAEVRRLRRADLGARRIGAGADRALARRAQGVAGPDDAVHRPRSVDGALRLRSNGRHVLGSLVEIGPADEVYFSPKHPYTQTLVASNPQPDPRSERERATIPIKGEIASPVNVGGGLSIREALPARHGRLPQRDSGAARDRRRARRASRRMPSLRGRGAGSGRCQARCQAPTLLAAPLIWCARSVPDTVPDTDFSAILRLL